MKRIIKVDMSLMDKEGIIARGSVIINNEIKFWVDVREFTDKETGQKHEFITYPQRRSGNPDRPYEDICYIADSELRYEVQEAVFNQVKELKELAKEESEIEVNITLVENPTDHLLAFASIKHAGLGIRGIRIVEGRNGEPFVSMPQFKDKNGKWHDQVATINFKAHQQVSEAVLAAYNKAKEQ